MDVCDAELKFCHDVICPELELRDFCIGYTEATENPALQNCGPEQLLQKLGVMDDQYLTDHVGLCRAALRERSINLYNKLKTSDRASLSPNTISNYLHISPNMCNFVEFDPTAADVLRIEEKERCSRPPLQRLSTKNGTSWFSGKITKCIRMKILGRKIKQHRELKFEKAVEQSS